MLLKALRKGVGSIVVLVDWVTRPKPLSRSAEDQAAAQAAMNGLSLYQLHACPFCVKTRRVLHKLNLKVDLKDIGKNSEHREALKEGGGRVMVPCLRIEENNEVRWMYESKDIIHFLEQRVTTA